jgi:hypothetical protein
LNAASAEEVPTKVPSENGSPSTTAEPPAVPLPSELPSGVGSPSAASDVNEIKKEGNKETPSHEWESEDLILHELPVAFGLTARVTL